FVWPNAFDNTRDKVALRVVRLSNYRRPNDLSYLCLPPMCGLAPSGNFVSFIVITCCRANGNGKVIVREFNGRIAQLLPRFALNRHACRRQNTSSNVSTLLRNTPGVYQLL